MISFTIPLTPVTKKNSQQILYKRNYKKPYGEKTPFIAPSKKFKQYESDAWFYIPKINHPIDYPVTVKCLFYMPTKRLCDLTNLLEAIDDAMVKAGLLADDNYKIIASHDGSRVYQDKENPRTEVYITEFEED